MTGRVVSLQPLVHVSRKNFNQTMVVLNRCLTEDVS
jgi:hypothetical protein